MLKFEVCLRCYRKALRTDQRFFIPPEEYFVRLWEDEKRCHCPYCALWGSNKVDIKPPKECPYVLEQIV
jgi:hypothetical protein